MPRDVVDRARYYLPHLEKHLQTLLPASRQTELKFAPEPVAVAPELDLLYQLASDAQPPR